MGNRLYFLILGLLMLTAYAIGHYFAIGPKYWFWAGAIIAIYIVCKKEFSGTRWLSGSAASIPPPSSKSVNNKPAVIPTQPDVETEKQGYRELIRLCAAPVYQQQLLQWINTFGTFTDEEDDGTRLNYVMRTLEEQEVPLIMALDWKTPVENLEWRLSTSIKSNFAAAAITLPSPEDYEPRTSVSSKNVFTDYDKPLREQGLQMGFINTHSDQYVIIVHRIADKELVAKAVKQTGYPYAEAPANL